MKTVTILENKTYYFSPHYFINEDNLMINNSNDVISITGGYYRISWKISSDHSIQRTLRSLSLTFGLYGMINN